MAGSVNVCAEDPSFVHFPVMHHVSMPFLLVDASQVITRVNTTLFLRGQKPDLYILLDLRGTRSMPSGNDACKS